MDRPELNEIFSIAKKINSTDTYGIDSDYIGPLENAMVARVFACHPELVPEYKH